MGSLLLAFLWLGLLAPGSLRAQDGDWSVLPAGQLRLGVSGGFLWAGDRFGVDGDVLPLGEELTRSNAALLFPGVETLGSSLDALVGPGVAAPTLGPSLTDIQTSQVQVPFTLELGLTSWFTLGATVPLVRSRVEGELAILPSAGANLGVNPAFAASEQVLDFTRSLSAAAAGLPEGQAEEWAAWAGQWVDAYAASAVFPAAGTAAGDALLGALADFNEVLTGAGLPTVDAAVPLAETVLDAQGFRQLLTGNDAHFQYFPVPIGLLWSVGDVEVDGRLKVLEGPALATTGRPAFGLTLLGTVRLPTGAGEDPRVLHDIPHGQGQLDLEAGAAGWLRNDRMGLGAAGRYTVARSGTVLRRVAPPGVPLVPVSNLAEVEWTPGDLMQLELRPSLAVAPTLWIEGRYRFLRKDPDTFVRLTPEVEQGDPIPFPSGLLGFTGSALEEQTAMRLHTLAGGLRFQPPRGEFPVEVWANVEVAVSGSGGQTLKRTRLEFGGRVHRALWGGG